MGINICEECDEMYCEVCRIEEERKWARAFENTRAEAVDLEWAYDSDDYKSVYLKGWNA